jgi:hypothetical protein
MYSFDHTAIPTRSITPLLSIKTLRRGRPACRRTARSPFLDVQSILKYADLSCVPIEDIEPERVKMEEVLYARIRRLRGS